ncbi:MAG: adenylate/guanylate cyclase domain-containing protein [Stellaceae bacterium]
MSEDARRRVRRQLAAILVAGYRQLLPGDEADIFVGLRAVLREIIEPLAGEHAGDIFKQTGELALIAFDSAVEAVRCGAALRDRVADTNQSLANEQRIAVQIGINLGDVIVEGGDVFGDGVNIAARLEALAESGSIYLSESIHDQVAGKVEFDFEYLGPQDLKNIRQPVRVFRMGGRRPDRSGQPAALSLRDAVPSPATTGFDDRRAIAVLPFANFSSDPEQEFFADGITEDIITMLGGWRAFPVIARNSTFTYKGQTVDVKKVGHELGVRYVLEGSVRKSGHRVRITAQLIRADTGHHITAERYDRDLTDLFELQDEITTTIAGAIQPELLKFERDRIADQPQHNEDAYELYQRGMWHHYRHTREDNSKAQSFLRRALTLDKRYPQATAALAITLTSAALLGWTDAADTCFEQAYDLAQRAVSLDQRFPNAHFALGLVCMWTRRATRGVAAFQDAIKLNPSFAAAHVLLGQMYLYSGHPEETIALAEKGIRLSPSDPRLFIWLPALAGAHYQLGHYAEAIGIGRRSWTLNRNWPAGLRYVVAGLAQLERLDEARAALAELRLLNPDPAFVEGNLKRLYSDPVAVAHILDALRKAGFE